MAPMLLIFVSIMIATIIISALPRITIWLMVLFRFYKKGYLTHELRNYADGGGNHVYRKVYCLRGNEFGEKFVNLQIFLRLLLISFIVCCIVAMILYLIGPDKLPGS